ncbi:hypothetical protein R3X28_19160, partial [Maribacter sp. TH_r10]|uniref:NADase-type glycan-binding domain-containing protein n=1 Tax=Maribacter sp. TH_r10 TaxID=3082086 RepID=UPI002952EAD9
MKLYIVIITIFLSANSFCQDLKTLVPIEGETFDFGIEVQNDWKKRDQLLEDLANEKKSWENLTEEENRLFEKYDETYESMWDVEGGGCSWYCGAGQYTVTTSSELSTNGKIDYKAKNLTDFSYQTAWVEGEKGYGIGTSINFSFVPTHPRVTTIIFANGYVKSKEAWKNNSRVHKLKVYVNNEPYAIIELNDIYSKQIVGLEKPLGNSDRDNFDKLKEKDNWTLRFEILSVYKGDKYDDTAISEIYFDGLDVHCLAKGTSITMGDNSQKAIEDLIVGDEILSFNKKSGKYESSVIKELASQIHKDLINIEFSNGMQITCTKDHPFLTNDLNWTSLHPKKTERDYEIDNVIKLKVGTKIKNKKTGLEVIKINEIDGKQITYTIVDLNKNKTFIANGIITGIEKLRV